MTVDIDVLIRGIVKGLGPWVQTATNAWECGHYHINHRWPHNDGPFYVSVSRGAEVGVVRLGQHSTLAAAQAAAEADYRARIAAALDMDALVELVGAVDAFRKTETDENYSRMLRALARIGGRG